MRVRNEPQAERWLYAVPMLALMHLALLTLLHSRPGLPAVVLWHFGPLLLTTAAIVLMAFGLMRSRKTRLTWTRGRTLGYAGLLIVTAMPLTYRTYPSSRDEHPSEGRYRLPLDGPVLVVWGGATRAVNYHVIAPAERWAYDLTVHTGGPRYRTDGNEVTDYYAYGRPVLAPAAGVVRIVSDGAPDRHIGSLFVGMNPCGNMVVMEVAPEEFLFVCHLQAGTMVVQPGDELEAGTVIGRVGNSGKSTEPHVHVHLQTTMRGDLAEGIPMYFHDYLLDGQVVDRGIPTGGRHPQVVQHAGPGVAPAARSFSWAWRGHLRYE